MTSNRQWNLIFWHSLSFFSLFFLRINYYNLVCQFGSKRLFNDDIWIRWCRIVSVTAMTSKWEYNTYTYNKNNKLFVFIYVHFVPLVRSWADAIFRFTLLYAKHQAMVLWIFFFYLLSFRLNLSLSSFSYFDDKWHLSQTKLLFSSHYYYNLCKWPGKWI